MLKLFLLLNLLVIAACGQKAAAGDDVVIVTTNGSTNNSNNTGGTPASTGGSETNNETPTEMTLGEYIAARQQLSCRIALECPNSSTLWLLRRLARYQTVDACAQSGATDYPDNQNLEASVEAGVVIYDPTHARDCIAAIEAAACTTEDWGRTVGGISNCEGVLRGTAAAGEPCANQQDCGEGYCDTTKSCAARTCVQTTTPCGGTECTLATEYCDNDACRPRKSIGESCSFGQCQSYSQCSVSEEGTCVAWGAQPAGDTCVLDSACQPGLACEDLTCKPVTFGAAGDACGWRGASACAPPLVCRVPSGTEVGTCGPPLGEGESCRLTAACGAGLMCDVWNDDVCKPYLSARQTCQSGAQCESGSCPGGMGSSADGICEPFCSL